MANPTGRAKPKKNKPKFFPMLMTLVFMAAGAYGVYRVKTMGESNPLPLFEQSTDAVQTDANTPDSTEPQTEATDADALAVAKEIAKADKNVTDAVVQYLAANVEAKQLKAVLDAIQNAKFEDETWYKETGMSFKTICSLAAGEDKSGKVTDLGRNEKNVIEIGFVGRVNFGAQSENMKLYAKSGKLSDCISADLLKSMNGMDIQVASGEFTFSADKTTDATIADPKTVDLFKEMGVDVVTLANDGAGANGVDALNNTASVLEKAGIGHIGAGKTAADAAKPVYYLVNGRKIAILGVMDTLMASSVPVATDSAAGVLSIKSGTAAATKAIAAAKAECDYVFVYMNAGVGKNADWAEDTQRNPAFAMIDAGADGIIGVATRSDHLQGMEYRKGKLAAFNIGDFWNDGETQDCGLLKVVIDREGNIENTFVPCKHDGGKTSVLPKEDAENVWTRIRTFCGNVVKFSEDGVVTAVR